MSANLSIILLNPALGVIFSCVFFLLWKQDESRPYVRLCSIMYLLSAVAFLLQQFDLPIGAPLSRLLSNLAFLAAASMMVGVMSLRYQRRVPWEGIGAFVLAGVAGAVWFTLISPNIVGRVYSVTSCVGALLVLAALQVLGRNRKPIDRVLMVLVGLNGAFMTLRSVLLIEMSGNLSAEALSRSPAWVAFVFSHSITSLIIATAIALAVVKDLIGEISVDGRTDVMSGLLNRRGFEEAAKSAISGARVPVALILCDLDHFKDVNDTFGHHAGDRVINEFGAVLIDLVGPSHPAGRVGGEEFAILLRGGDGGVARVVAIGLGIAYTHKVRPEPDSEMRLTASFGIAQLREGETYSDLMQRADAALYRAKRQGRDCVVVDDAVAVVRRALTA